jgi:hypothetical protein
VHEANGDDALSQTMTYDWFKCFKNEITLMAGADQSARPTSRTEPDCPGEKHYLWKLSTD